MIEKVIRLVIIALLWIPAYVLAMRYNLHMFQLNGYKNNEQITWLKKNIRKQWILIWDFSLGLARCFFYWLWLDIVIAISLIMTILVFRAHKRLNTKKKLVVTARVKRLIVTLLILSDAIVMPLSLFVCGWLSTGLLLCTLGTLFWLVIGLPSFIWCHCFESYRQRNRISYYVFYPEKWANYNGQKATGLQMKIPDDPLKERSDD